MELKIISFAILIFSYAFTRSLTALVIGPLTLVPLWLISRLSPEKFLSAIKAPLFFSLLMSPFILLTPGLGLVDSGALVLSIAFKSLTIFSLLAILTNNNESSAIVNSLKKLGIPGKFILILISTWRYINLYITDLGKMITAARIRGFSMTKGLSHMKVSADILLTLLIRSYEQSERVQAAMISRGFNGDLPVLILKENNIVKRQRLLSAVSLLGAVGIMIVEIL